MVLETVIPVVTSVHMSDYLAKTLPVNRDLFEIFVVVTSSTDLETHAVCREHDVRIITYDDFRGGGARFNKSGAIRYAQQVLHAQYPDMWILLMDTDIILPENFVAIASARLRDKTALYGMPRLDVHDDTQTETYPMQFVGYFQAYFDKTKLYARHSMDASVCDWKFKNEFPSHIALSASETVTHIGRSQMHWHGRTCPIIK
jgi:GT2 family glycosyltransferase